MPYSISLGMNDFVKWTIENSIDTVLDIGAGSGKYAENLKHKVKKIDAIEVFEHYINKFSLKDKYDNVILCDVRDHNDFNYDLVILGDVLEHMKRSEAVDLWSKISSQAKYAFISIPIGECPQDGAFYDIESGILMSNPYERHVEPNSTVDEILEKFSGIFNHKIYDIPWVKDFETYFQIGTFYAKFR